MVRFDKKLQRFLELSTSEVAKVTGAPQRADREEIQPGNGYKRLVLHLRRFSAFRVLASAKDWFVIHVVHQGQSSFARLANKHAPTLLDGGTYLTSEIVGEPDRTQVLRYLHRNRGLKLTFVVHDLIPLSHPEFSLVNGADFHRYTKLLKHSGMLFCVSATTEREVRIRLGASLRTAVALPGFLPDTTTTSRKSSEASSYEGRPLVVWVGTIEPRKNQEALLSVLKQLWDSGLVFRFVFAGNQGRRSGSFSTAFERLRSDGYPIHWIRGASEDQISVLYRQARFTVYLSLVEGYGLPVLESLAQGTPCLTSQGTSMAEIAEIAGGCVLVDPKDHSEIRVAMSRLLVDEEWWKSRKESINHEAMPTWGQYRKKVYDLVAETADQAVQKY
jgi:glycosyltransferase involved in cell wall biosynthesis